MFGILKFNDAIAWWTEGLGYLCPASISKVFNPVPALITIEFKEQQVLFKRYSNSLKEASEIRQFVKTDDIERAVVLSWLQENLQHNCYVSLIIPDELFLTKKMAFPKAASSNLREVLSFEMNRKTPFTPEQTYYDYLLNENNVDSDKVHLELFLVPRDRIDSILGELNTWDIELDSIKPVSQYDNPRLNLLSAEKRPQENVKSDNALLILVTTTCLLLVALLFAPIINQQKNLSLLESEIVKQRKTAMRLQELRQDKEKILGQMQFLKNKRANEISSLKLIDEVTQIIPDDTWLTRFVMKTGDLQLQGESSNASSLIQTLDSSAYFTKVQFRSPVTQNRSTGKDKFHLSAKFKQERI